MKDYQLGMVEAKFADIIWENEPITSSELIKLCEKRLNWNKSTTYTVLRRLSSKGIFCLQNGSVTSKISRKRFYASQSNQYIEENFSGSLPAFLTAFSSNKRLSEKDIESIKKMIEAYEEEN